MSWGCQRSEVGERAGAASKVGEEGVRSTCGWKPGEEWPRVEPLELLRCVQLVACVKSLFREIVEGDGEDGSLSGKKGSQRLALEQLLLQWV